MTHNKRFYVWFVGAVCSAVTYAGLFALLGIWFPWAGRAVPFVFLGVLFAVLCIAGVVTYAHPDTGG